MKPDQTFEDIDGDKVTVRMRTQRVEWDERGPLVKFDRPVVALDLQYIIEDPTWPYEAGVYLDPATARAIGWALIEQALDVEDLLGEIPDGA